MFGHGRTVIGSVSVLERQELLVGVNLALKVPGLSPVTNPLLFIEPKPCGSVCQVPPVDGKSIVYPDWQMSCGPNIFTCIDSCTKVLSGFEIQPVLLSI